MAAKLTSSQKKLTNEKVEQNIKTDKTHIEAAEHHVSPGSLTFDQPETPTSSQNDLANTNSSGSEEQGLTSAEKARCERNRQKALLLRQSRLANQQLHGDNRKTVGFTRVIDTGGGFLIEEDSEAKPTKLKKVEELAPVIAGELSICLECDQPFLDSYLIATYDYSVCDKCRDSEEKHMVITKTQAKETYLLSETDLTIREPVLKCVVRKNPRNNRWGDMKLFLKIQIEKRALEVWGSPEALEEERSAREAKKEELKRKKFNKKMKKLRQEVRSSLYEVKTSGHEHVFGPEVPSDGEDMWKKTCTLCGYDMVFEKM